MKKLIVNADDYGLCSSVNQGIIECYNKGLVSDFSFIINPDFIDESVKKLQEEKVTDCGIHFNITLGKSKFGKSHGVTNNDGKFFNSSKFFFDWIKGKLNKEGIYSELRSQLKFLMSCNFNITHFDSHQNVHLIPDIFILLEKLKEEFNLKNVPTRLPIERISFYHRYKLSNLQRIIILNFLSYFSKRKLSKPTTVKTLGGNFYNNTNPARVFDFVIKNMENEKLIYEIAVHPGYLSQDILKYDPYSHQREIELSFLKNISKKELESKVKIIAFKDLS